MKKCLLILYTVVASFASAQTTDGEKQVRTKFVDTLDGWKKGGVINIGLSQTSLTNWAAGGQSSVAINGLLSLFSRYHHGSLNWETTLDLGYGVLQQGKSARWIKTDDKIDLTSKLGMAASKKWYYAGLLNFRTQMAPGLSFPNDSTVVKISDFLAPGYLLGAIGMDYKPNDKFNLFIAPITGKVTIVNNQTLADAGAFGVVKAVYDPITNLLITPGKVVRTEFGGYIRMMAKFDIMKNINFQTQLDLFSNYLNNPQNIDVNWSTLIAMKVNKYISATITTQLIYDHDINIAIDTNNDGNVDASGPRTQFKEVLAVGFSYKFK